MTFTLIFKDISEERDIPKENYTIKDLLNDLELSSQTIVPKQNGELVIEESEIHDDDEIRFCLLYTSPSPRDS